MGKMKEIMLNASQIAIANRQGIPLERYAELLSTQAPIVTMTVFNPNNHPVYSIPLSELVNLWRAKFGDTWIDVSELEEDFWSDASARLHTNKKMEELNHHSDNSPWARLKEDA